MKNKKYFVILLAFLFIQFFGCSGSSKSRVVITNNRPDINEVELKLSEAADSVSNSLRELAEISKTVHPQRALPSPVNPKIIGMDQLGTVDWSGPIGPFVKKIAEVTNYKLHVLGTPPPVPILISIVAKDTMLADILRDAEFQCGNRANIIIYPASKLIELRYTRYDRSKSTYVN